MASPPRNEEDFPEPTPTGEFTSSKDKSHSGSANKGGEDPKGSKQKEQSETFVSFAKENIKDTIAYVLMIIGILMMFFAPIYGQLVVGIIFSIYFSKEISRVWNNLDGLVEAYGVVKSLMLGGVLLALFIAAPLIFISAGIVAALKILVKPEEKRKKKP